MEPWRRVRRWMSPLIKPVFRRIRYRFAELTDRGNGPKIGDITLPPRALQLLNGPGDFDAMGRAILDDVRRTVGVHADDHVLDVGCGSGRVALQLVDVIGRRGSYDGLDVVPEAVSWCRRRITPARPNFRFQRADVRSDHYHRRGAESATHYRFPYADETFDLVILTSVFTHLREAATENYLRESARVLSPTGRLFATFFLLDDDVKGAMSAGRTEMTFVPGDDSAHVAAPRDPDAAVAHEAATIRSILNSAGLDPTIRRGHWSGHEEVLGFQDLVTGVKTSAADP